VTWRIHLYDITHSFVCYTDIDNTSMGVYVCIYIHYIQYDKHYDIHYDIHYIHYIHYDKHYDIHYDIHYIHSIHYDIHYAPPHTHRKTL